MLRDLDFGQSIDLDPLLLAAPWRSLVVEFRRFLDDHEAELRLLSPEERLVRFLGAVGDRLPALGAEGSSWVVSQIEHACADPEWGPPRSGVVEVARARKARDDREVVLDMGAVLRVALAPDEVAAHDAEVAALHEEVSAYLSAQDHPDVPPAPEDGAVLLDAVLSFVRRFVVLEERQAVACTLWVVHSHAIGAAQTTAYLHATSPEKRSGKSTLLEVLELLAPRTLLTANISPAALFRLLAEAPPPTVFVDEVDAIFSRRNGSESSEDLRGLLNAGYRRGLYAVRMVGQGAAMKPERFAVFGAKALAGIRDLPDTLADRCIRIEMHRKTAGEGAAKFRRRKVAPEADELRVQIAAWAEVVLDSLADAEPEVPDALDDRAAEGWEPLIAIADAAGGTWPGDARQAAVKLSAHRADTDSDSLGVRLLADIRRVFDAHQVDRLFSSDLVSALVEIEEAPWADLRGRSLTKNHLARILAPYGVKPRSVRVGEKTAKGYPTEAFEDAWKRYVASPPASERSQRHNPHVDGGNGDSATVNGPDALTVADGEFSALGSRCDGVTVEDAGEGDADPSGDDLTRWETRARDAEEGAP